MVAEPSVGRRRLRSDGFWQDPSIHVQAILEEIDADLAAMDDTGAAAAAATQVEMSSAATAGAATAVDRFGTPGQLRVRPVAQRVAMQTNANDVVIDPRLLSKPSSCPTERGAS